MCCVGVPVCMHICVRVWACVRAYLPYQYACIYVCCVGVPVCMHICVRVWACVRACLAYQYACIYACCVGVPVRMHVCICVWACVCACLVCLLLSDPKFKGIRDGMAQVDVCLCCVGMPVCVCVHSWHVYSEYVAYLLMCVVANELKRMT